MAKGSAPDPLGSSGALPLIPLGAPWNPVEGHPSILKRATQHPSILETDLTAEHISNVGRGGDHCDDHRALSCDFSRTCCAHCTVTLRKQKVTFNPK